MTTRVGEARFPALGTTAVVLVADASAISRARAAVEQVIAAVDRACNRFRGDSDLTKVNARAGEDVAVSAWLVDAVEVALDAARATDGLVDPTVASAMREIGYDRDFEEVSVDGPPLRVIVRPVPGWHRVAVDRERGTIRVPNGVAIDLGATAKAWCADRAAGAVASRSGCGVVVALGGDLSCAGDPPPGGWRVRVADDHRAAADAKGGQTVAISAGGLATSGTSVRRWMRGGRSMHHIVDPATGRPAADYWRTVSVAAASCTDGNIASTAAIVLGSRAPAWLAARNLPARLVRIDGDVTVVGGWPGP